MLMSNKYESWSSGPHRRRGRPRWLPLSDWEVFLSLCFLVYMLSAFGIATWLLQ